jgi:predicted anti-sigma-YlaC factor YlaD
MKHLTNHLSNDELVNLVYGVGASGHIASEHINDCRECSDRFEQLRERRAMAADALPVSHEFLAAQRRNIYARMGERPQARMKWVPALAAAACLVAVGVFSYHPAQVATPEAPDARVETHVDAQLFADVYSMEQSMEPLAAQPIHALFEQDK